MTGKKTADMILTAVTALVMAVLIITLTVIGLSDGGREKIEQKQSQTMISMSWWGNDDRHVYTLKGLDIFQKANPDIEVSHHYGVWNGYETRAKVSMKAHTESDVMQINFAWLNTYSKDGTGFYDLNELADVIDLSGYTAADLSYGTVNGKLNALPIAYNSVAFFYNKDILDKYGLDVPVTWDDFFDDAKVLSRDNIYPISMAKKMMWLFIVAEYEQKTGKTLFNEEGTLEADSGDMKIMLDFYKRLIDEKVFQPVDDFSISDMNDGTTCGVMCWINDSGRYCDELSARGTNVVLGTAPSMKGAERSGWYMKPATMYAISSITDHPEVAGRLLNFLVNDTEMAELQGAEKGVPVCSKARNAVLSGGDMDRFEAEADKQMLQNRDSLNTFTPELEDEDIIDIFKEESDRYIYDKTDVDTCAQEIVSRINGR